MADLQWLLDLTLVLLLAATLFHALRLERALGVLKRDRSALESLVAEFNDSTREAHAGIDKLRSAADGAGRLITRQTETATGLRDDLVFLIDRGEKLADRMDVLVRAGRSIAPEPVATGTSASTTAARPDWRALLDAELPGSEPAPQPRKPAAVPAPVAATPPLAAGERVRSQAERNLLAALRMVR